MPKRSYSRSERTSTVPDENSRATGASDWASNVPSCMRRSSASSRLAVCGEPYGSTSRAITGRSVSPGVIGSIGLPHRYAEKFEPGISRMRVAWLSRSSAAVASTR